MGCIPVLTIGKLQIDITI